MGIPSKTRNGSKHTFGAALLLVTLNRLIAPSGAFLDEEGGRPHSVMDTMDGNLKWFDS